MELNPPLIIEEKEVLMLKYFEKGIDNFRTFKKKDLIMMSNLFKEINNYGK